MKENIDRHLGHIEVSGNQIILLKLDFNKSAM